MTPQEIEADIVRRVFDESFLNEKLLTKLLRDYGAACAAEMRERAAQSIDDEIARITRDDPKAESEYFSAVCFHFWQRAAAIRALD